MGIRVDINPYSLRLLSLSPPHLPELPNFREIIKRLS